MKTLLKVKDLKFKYNSGQEALSGINLEIYRGEKLVLLGSNGSGKSTLFLNLNGVLTPNEGTIYLKDREISNNKKDLNELRKTVGIVFQNAENQIIASTVENEISFGPMNLNLTPEEVVERINYAIEEMHISDLRNRATHFLSGGEKKKVTIADVIAMKPEILIFDEPTASLDPYGIEMLEETLELLNSKDNTIVISTHIVDFAWKWADRIIVLNEGKIIGEGDPITIFKDKELLKKAHLKQPVLMNIIDKLKDKNLIPEDTIYPRNIIEFNNIINKLN